MLLSVRKDSCDILNMSEEKCKAHPTWKLMRIKFGGHISAPRDLIPKLETIEIGNSWNGVKHTIVSLPESIRIV